MKRPCPPGLTAQLEYPVPAERTMPHLAARVGGVLQWTCTRALTGHLEPDEQTLGVHVDGARASRMAIARIDEPANRRSTIRRPSTDTRTSPTQSAAPSAAGHPTHAATDHPAVDPHQQTRRPGTTSIPPSPAARTEPAAHHEPAATPIAPQHLHNQGAATTV